MRPEWFAIPAEYHSHGAIVDHTLPPIPYDQMWEDDRLWMPFLLSKTLFVGRVDLARHLEDGVSKYLMKKWWFGTPNSMQ